MRLLVARLVCRRRRRRLGRRDSRLRNMENYVGQRRRIRGTKYERSFLT